MKKITLSQVAAALGLKCDTYGEIDSVSIDSRSITANSLFVAIKGENFDGHDYIKAAVENGAVAVVSEKKVDCEAALFLVESTHQALLDLAKYYRCMFDIKVVGITGSVGKTTTKEMTYAVLSERFNTLKTQGNLNNEIGLPKTLFCINEETQAAVIEMGMSDFGEISLLSKAALPDIAIISNIGVSHIETLGSRENICKAKTEIFDGMKEDAPVILNGDDPYLVNAKTGNHKVYYYAVNSTSADFRAQNIEQDGFDTTFEIVHEDIVYPARIPTIGVHNVYNALAAFAAGFLLGIDPQSAVRGLMNYEPSGMRQRVKNVNGVTFIEDCYNASPDSLRAALSALSDIKAQRKIAVLGDMLELGAMSVHSHSSVGTVAAKKGVDAVITYGEMAKLIAQRAADGGVKITKSFMDKDELAIYLKDLIKPGDAVLFKASRGMRLEEVIEKLY